MTDIVERLKKYVSGMGTRNVQDYTAFMPIQEVFEAANEIERLRNQKKELLDMVLENLGNEYPEYKLKYEGLNKQYESEKKYLMEKFRD